MGGAAAVIDVDAVGIGVNHVGVQVGEPVKQPGRSGRGRAVGTVHQNMQPRQLGADGGNQVVDIVLGLLLIGVNHPADLPAGLEGHGDIVQQNFLNLPLQLVGELEALAVENFDSVVLKGVVGGGNHDARIRLGVHGDPRHGGCGNHAQVEHIRPRGAQPRNQRPLQQIRGDAGILADGEAGLSASLLPGHHLRGGHAHPEGQHGVQSVVDDTADAVGSK